MTNDRRNALSRSRRTNEDIVHQGFNVEYINTIVVPVNNYSSLTCILKTSSSRTQSINKPTSSTQDAFPSPHNPLPLIPRPRHSTLQPPKTSPTPNLGRLPLPRAPRRLNPKLQLLSNSHNADQRSQNRNPNRQPPNPQLQHPPRKLARLKTRLQNTNTHLHHPRARRSFLRAPRSDLSIPRSQSNSHARGDSSCAGPTRARHATTCWFLDGVVPGTVTAADSDMDASPGIEHVPARRP